MNISSNEKENEDGMISYKKRFLESDDFFQCHHKLTVEDSVMTYSRSYPFLYKDRIKTVSVKQIKDIGWKKRKIWISFCIFIIIFAISFLYIENVTLNRESFIECKQNIKMLKSLYSLSGESSQKLRSMLFEEYVKVITSIGFDFAAVFSIIVFFFLHLRLLYSRRILLLVYYDGKKLKFPITDCSYPDVQAFLENLHQAMEK